MPRSSRTPFASEPRYASPHKHLRLVILYCTTLLAICGPSLTESRVHADIVDSFDSENGGVGVLNYDQFANFNVIAGSVDLIGNGFFDLYPGNGLYVDLNGSTGQSGTIETISALDPGLYTLSFLIGNNPNSSNSVTVSLGDYTEQFIRSSIVDFELIERQVTVVNSSKLRFETPLSDNDWGGIVIDAVSVTAVPEPSSVALFLLGALLIAARKRDRTKR